MAKEEKKEEKKVKEAPAKAEKALNEKKGTVNVQILNLRDKPSMDSAVKGALVFGEEVTIILTNSKYEINGWFKVRTKSGEIGFVVAQFINGE